MAARHSTARRRAANAPLNREGRPRAANGRQPSPTGGIGRRLPPAVNTSAELRVAGGQQMQLAAGYALLSLIVEGLRHSAPPFNDPSNPLCQRAIELARDMVGAGLAGEGARARRRPPRSG